MISTCWVGRRNKIGRTSSKRKAGSTSPALLCLGIQLLVFGRVCDLIGKAQQVSDPTGTYVFAGACPERRRRDNMGRLIGTTTQYSYLPGFNFQNAYTSDAGGWPTFEPPHLRLGWPILLISVGTTNTVGCPILRVLFAKGGRRSDGIMRLPSPRLKRKRIGSIASHPCKKRKDGAPHSRVTGEQNQNRRVGHPL